MRRKGERANHEEKAGRRVPDKGIKECKGKAVPYWRHAREI